MRNIFPSSLTNHNQLPAFQILERRTDRSEAQRCSFQVGISLQTSHLKICSVLKVDIAPQKWGATFSSYNLIHTESIKSPHVATYQPACLHFNQGSNVDKSEINIASNKRLGLIKCLRLSCTKSIPCAKGWAFRKTIFCMLLLNP